MSGLEVHCGPLLGVLVYGDIPALSVVRLFLQRESTKPSELNPFSFRNALFNVVEKCLADVFGLNPFESIAYN